MIVLVMGVERQPAKAPSAAPWPQALRADFLEADAFHSRSQYRQDEERHTLDRCRPLALAGGDRRRA